MRKILLLRLRSAGTTPFDPSTLAGLWGWYDFSDLTKMFTTSVGSTNVASDGDLCGRIEDKSVNARHLTVADANRPTYKTGVFGSRAAMLFGVGGAAKTLTSAVNVPNTTFTIVAAIKTPSSIAGGTAYSPVTTYDTAAGGGTRCFFIDTDGVIKSNTSPTSIIISSGITPPVSTAYIASITINASGSPTRSLQINQNAAVTDATAVTSADKVLRIGSHQVNNTNNFWTGHVGEVIVCSPALSASDLLSVQTYLNGRWGAY